jgi:small GTP-binding protein
MEKRRIQCGIIGNAYVGKTTFAQTLRKDPIGFAKTYHPTIGVDFVSSQLEIDKILYNVTMWDLTGGERFRSIITTYFKSIKIALVCFSYDNIESINNLDYWINLIEEQNDDSYIVLIGMKKDRISSIKYVGDDIIEKLKKTYTYKLYSVDNYNYQLVSSIMQEIIRDGIFYNKFNSTTINKNYFFKQKKKKQSNNKYTRYSDWCCWC